MMREKKALITGGTKGLGLACARELLSRGYAEFFLSYRRDEAAAQNASRELEEQGARVHLLSIDLTEDGSTERLWTWAMAGREKSLDLYIHNAAATAFRSLLELEGRHFDKTFALSAKRFFEALPWAVRAMAPGGAIVTVSGMDTTRMVPGHGLLAAAKSALETLTRYAAHDLAPKEIRVNGVNPGFFPSESTRIYLGAQFEALTAQIATKGPWKRSPELAEVARVIAFLASPDATWVTGQILSVDGGQGFAG